MLSAQHRLRRRSDFQFAIRHGRRAASPALVAHFAIDGSAPPRVGFAVGRDVGGAVARNLVRRRLRHAVRERIDTLPAGTLLVVRALHQAEGAAYAELRMQLDRVLSRLIRGDR